MPYKGSKADARHARQNAWDCVAEIFKPLAKKRKYIGVKRKKIQDRMEENGVERYRLSLTIFINRDGILYESQGKLWLNRNIYGHMEKGEEVTFKKAKTYSRGISNAASYPNYYPGKRTIISPI